MKRNLVFFYWLLLLVSTLAIGGETFYLLQRESDRLRKIASDSAVHTGQTIVSNLELLVNDVKTTSMDSLAKLPEASLMPQLMVWKDSNPFARSVFLYQPGTGLVLPVDHQERDALDPLIHNPNGGLVWSGGQGPRRGGGTFAGSRGGRPPSGGTRGPNPGAPPMPDNYSQLTAARQQIRQIGRSAVPANSGNPDNLAVGNNSLNSTSTLNNNGMNVVASGNNLGVPQLSVILNNGTFTLSGALPEEFLQNLPATYGDELSQGFITTQLVINSSGNTPQGQWSSNQQTIQLITSGPLSRSSRQDHDWVPVGPPDDSRWLGWLRTAPGGPVRGIVLSWSEIEKTMGKAIPENLDSSVGFILTNPAGQHILGRFGSGRMIIGGGGSSQVVDPNAQPATEPVALLPFGAEMPGWNLAVYFNPTANLSSGFMALSTSLVTVLVITVLVGGTLLMREARREAFDAARKTGFVSNVSHELKTPLTTIRMYAELLGEGRVRDPAKQRNYLTTIINESQRLTRLVNNVLDFSRLEQGRKQYHPDNVSLIEIVETVIEGQRPRLEEAGFVLETDFPMSADVRVHTDRDALEQVLLNLIDNALKYAANGCWLKVQVTCDAERAYLAVSDHGAGVPVEHQERIFEMFHRVDDSITARLPGAGLGLSIARRLLRDQEGDLSYRTNEPQGASFVAALPLASVISAAKIN